MPSDDLGPLLLDSDRLADLRARLLAARGPLAADLSGAERLPAPVIQLLACAARDGRAVRLDGVRPALAGALALLGLDGLLLHGEGAA